MWISLVIAVSPVILAILAHHKLISPALAERFGVLSAMGAVVSTAPASDGQ